MNGRRMQVLLGFLGAILLGPASLAAQGTWRVSVDSSGNQGNAGGNFSYPAPAVSHDGRFVAFDSLATNLVPGDTNGSDDVFVRDRLTGTTTRVSVDSSGIEGNSYSGYQSASSISSHGRFVAFESYATNLVPGDTNSAGDVFVHDRQTGTTLRASVDSSGVEGNAISVDPSISSDGLRVAFASGASNLVPADTNGVPDVFVHDFLTGTTTRVSVDSAGNEGNASSGFSDTLGDVSISGDGQLVAFVSDASNLVPGDTNGAWDVFVHDLLTGTTSRVSVDSSLTQGNEDSARPSISADGWTVAFGSQASNLVPVDTNGTWDIFVHDRMTGATSRVSVDSSGSQGSLLSQGPSISADGQFVSFQSFASDLVPGDGNDRSDIFVHDTLAATTRRVSVDSAGTEGNGDSVRASLSADGRFVAYQSRASDLVLADTNGVDDVFVHGSYLTLEAVPEAVGAGDNLDLTTWRGLPFGTALLYVVDVNGTPFLLKVFTGSFDAQGVWTVSAIVPPGVSGNVVSLLTIGQAPTAKLDLTNIEVVTLL